MLAHVCIVYLSRIEVGRLKNGRPSYVLVNGYGIKILAAYTDQYKRGEILFDCAPVTLKDARAFCKANGLETSLPSIGHIQACTTDKSPYFFTRSSRKFHDTGRAHRLKVIRGSGGEILVTNGRSYWEFTGDDLNYSH